MMIKMHSITVMKVLVTLGQPEVHRVLAYRLFGHRVPREPVIKAVGPSVVAFHDPVSRGQLVHTSVIIGPEHVSGLGVGAHIVQRS